MPDESLKALVSIGISFKMTTANYLIILALNDLGCEGLISRYFS